MIGSAGWGLDQRATRLGSAHARRQPCAEPPILFSAASLRWQRAGAALRAYSHHASSKGLTPCPSRGLQSGFHPILKAARPELWIGAMYWVARP
jgi:hypothetical protein